MAGQERGRGEGPGRREPRRDKTGRQRAVLGLLLIVAGVLILLSLVSYSPGDEAAAGARFSDLAGLLTGDPQARAKADVIQNWLGLVGALLAETLIVATIGYPVLVLPFLLILWGWTVFRDADLRRTLTGTNYAILSALLLSASLGMIRLMFPDGGIGMAWSGLVGDFLAQTLARLLGKAGGSLLLLLGIVLVVVFAADIDLQRFAAGLRSWWLRLLDSFQRAKDSVARLNARRIDVRRPVRGEDGAVRDHPPPDDHHRPAEEPARVHPVREEREGPSVPTGVRRVRFGPPASDGPPQDEHQPAVPSPGTSGAPADAYVLPSVDLLAQPAPDEEGIDEAELQANANLLRDTLAEFDVEVESVSVTPGPVVTLYELVPASGVKISRIVSLENDIALNLAAKGIRMLAPIPGKAAVGVEIPNSHRALVTIRSVIASPVFQAARAHLPLALGKTISGDVFTDDLARMPHLLIAGSTGSGKSVGINTILTSLFFRLRPSELKVVIIDPKKIELAQYAKLKNHFLAVSPDANEDIVTTPGNAVLALRGVEFEMERRYDRLAHAGVRNIVDYNDRLRSGRLRPTEDVAHAPIPYLLVVIDELADLMITAAREVEEPIARLAQLARAVGIHLIVATQRPSVDVITGVIKANFPARIAYQVASKTDSRTILDMNGAEQLLGNGDMLYLASGSPKPIRLQNAYISPDEVEAVVDHIHRQQGEAGDYLLPSLADRKKAAASAGSGERDELFEEAARLIVRHQQGSVSLLQRRLKVGYSRAARLVDELEAAGIVGPYDGSKARAVLIESDADLDIILQQQE